MKKLIYSLLFLITALFVSCSDKDSATTNKSNLKLDSFTDKAWLRNSLPNNMLAYTRLPTLWFGLTGQSNGFKYAQGNEVHVQEVKKIQQSLYKLLAEEVGQQEMQLLDVILKRVVAPIELAALPLENGNPSPLLVLATKFNYKSQDELQKALQDIITNFGLPLEITVDNNGVGRLSMQGLNLVYRYQESTKQFVILSGPQLAPADLDKGLANLVDNAQHPMHALESEIDASGLGLFAWANSQQLLPLANMFFGWREAQQLETMGIDKMNALAFGYGVSEGKTRLKFMIDMPNVGFREFIPVAKNDFSLDSVGTPRSVGLIALPTSKEVDKVINAFAQLEPDANDSYKRFKGEFERELGLSLVQAIDMLGPEIVYFADDIGSFYATKLNDSKSLNTMIDYLIKQGLAKYRVHKKDGINFYHLQIDSMYSDMLNSLSITSSVVDRFMINGLKTHLYWIEEDGYLVYSSVPQKLIERLNKRNKVSINKWLKNTQSVDLSSSLLAYNSSIKDLSRTSYHYYLEVMTFLADVSGSDFDILALPTADKLGFSDMGTIGFQVDNGEQYLGFELTFEQSMSDLLATLGGMETVAVVGVLAAVAIPAYQDYIERASSYDDYECVVRLDSGEFVKTQDRSKCAVSYDNDEVIESAEEIEVEEYDEVEIEETVIESSDDNN